MSQCISRGNAQLVDRPSINVMFIHSVHQPLGNRADTCSSVREPFNMTSMLTCSEAAIPAKRPRTSQPLPDAPAAATSGGAAAGDAAASDAAATDVAATALSAAPPAAPAAALDPLKLHRCGLLVSEAQTYSDKPGMASCTVSMH